MKRQLITAALLMALTMVPATLWAGSPAKVRIVNHSGGKIYFQPEAALGYTEILSADTVMTIDGKPAYYRLVDAQGTFYPVYLAPGSETGIELMADGKVGIDGTFEAENRFMREHPYICRVPESVKKYSDEWTAYNEGEIARLDSLLDASALDKEFVATHKLYNRYTLLNQRLGGLTLAMAFRPGGAKIEIPEGFYGFLDTLRFDDPRILSVPKWFDVMQKAMETKESRGLIPVSDDDYMSIYASQIDDEAVRSHFLTELLALTLKRNYLNDFSRQLPRVQPLVTDSAAKSQLPELEARYARQVEESAGVAAGTEMPVFTFRDVDGGEYSITDFRGNYVVVDFWFTGCVPCKAEMPYFDKVAAAFEGTGVKFISLSVDTGELYDEWVRTIRAKAHAPGVLSVNLPDGFNSPLLKRLGIRGVPRIMIVAPEGRILEGYAKRPSDPKFATHLRSLLD